jgi:hypothetical protein
LPLVEVAFVLWLFNCLLVSAIAHFAGWGLAMAIVAGGWTVLCTIAFVGERFIDREDIKRMPFREKARGVVASLGYTLCILAALLFFPLAYFGVLAHGRFEARRAARVATTARTENR